MEKKEEKLTKLEAAVVLGKNVIITALTLVLAVGAYANRKKK